MENSPNTYSNKKFWLWWILHLIAISLIFWLVAGPIITVTYHSGGKELSSLDLIILLGFILLPLVIFQLIALIFCSSGNSKRKWLTILLSYPVSIGPIITCSLRLTDQWKMQTAKIC